MNQIWLMIKLYLWFYNFLNNIYIYIYIYINNYIYLGNAITTAFNDIYIRCPTIQFYSRSFNEIDWCRVWLENQNWNWN